MTNLTPSDAPDRVRQLAADLAHPEPMRRGSLSERAIRCGKSGCACAHDPKARHGPYYSLTRAVRGKTHSRFLTAGQAQQARQQIGAGQQFRARVEAYWEACESWADRQLAESTGSPEELKKKGFKRNSKTKSSKKSKPS
jgi:hypothetical protein